MRIPSYLHKHPSGIYYFRMSVPKDQRPQIGKTEIKKSLKTRDPKVAAQRARIMGAGLIEVEHGDLRIRIDHNDPEQERKTLETVTERLKDAKSQRPSAPPKLHEIPEQQEESPTFSELAELYIAEKTKTGSWNDKTTYENRKIFETTVEIVGDPPIKLFTHGHARTLASVLQKLPPNRKKTARYRDLSIEEIKRLNLGSEHTLSISAVNRHLGCVSGLLIWANRQGYIDNNVMEGKLLRERTRADKQRKVFSDEDLKLIFKEKRRGPYPYQYWLPYLALYTGARIEELCSLYKSDIREEDGVWIFDINPRKDKKLKTDYSERLVPIHSKLRNAN